MWQKITIDWKQ